MNTEQKHATYEDKIIFHVNRLVYRIDESKPAIINFDGSLYWYSKALDGTTFPYRSIKFMNPDYMVETFFIKKDQKILIHKDNGPALKVFYKGNLAAEKYYKNDLQHHDNGPAETIWTPNGKMARQIYYNEGKIHNLNGPAIIDYEQDGLAIKKEAYYINDEQISKKIYLKNLLMKTKLKI